MWWPRLRLLSCRRVAIRAPPPPGKSDLLRLSSPPAGREAARCLSFRVPTPLLSVRRSYVLSASVPGSWLSGRRWRQRGGGGVLETWCSFSIWNPRRTAPPSAPIPAPSWEHGRV